MRGQVFCINGIKFFTFGGAHSIDRMYRKESFSWFLEELPSREVVAAMGYGELSDDEVELRQFLQRVADNTDFTAWYFGHFHEDMEVEEQFFCLYDEMVTV